MLPATRRAVTLIRLHSCLGVSRGDPRLMRSAGVGPRLCALHMRVNSSTPFLPSSGIFNSVVSSKKPLFLSFVAADTKIYTFYGLANWLGFYTIISGNIANCHHPLTLHIHRNLGQHIRLQLFTASQRYNKFLKQKFSRFMLLKRRVKEEIALNSFPVHTIVRTETYYYSTTTFSINIHPSIPPDIYLRYLRGK